MAVAAPRAGRRSTRSSWVLVGAAVGVQIVYPLVPDALTTAVTVCSVVVFFLASLVDVVRVHGVRGGVGLVGVAGGGGLVAEAVGVATGVPFGPYVYTGTLGPEVLGVPVIVPLAWAMMAWPALVVGRALAQRGAAVVAIGTFALAAWDVFLDPQMVAAGHWTWRGTAATLPGVAHVPLTNFVGWFAVGVVVSALLQALLDRQPDGDDRPMYALYVWMWLSSTVALGGFLHLGAAAAWGFLAMGSVAVPLLLRLRSHPA
jgi:putative membrane protein